MCARDLFWSYANRDSNEYHLIGANLALRKNIVKKIGFFNEKIIPNEETELLRRLKNSGFKLVYKKELYIHRNHRKSLSDLARQFHHYGIGRMKQILYNGSIEDLIFIFPAAFLFYSISLFFFNPEWFLTPLFLYFILSFATSWKASFKYGRPSLIFTLPVIFFVIHISYALGIVDEFLNSIIKIEKKETVIKMRVKKIGLADLRNNPDLT